jgi:hypothetical protein
MQCRERLNSCGDSYRTEHILANELCIRFVMSASEKLGVSPRTGFGLFREVKLDFQQVGIAPGAFKYQGVPRMRRRSDNPNCFMRVCLDVLEKPITASKRVSEGKVRA